MSEALAAHLPLLLAARCDALTALRCLAMSCGQLGGEGQLLDAGMNVARLNFSHGDHELHLRSLSNLREAIRARPGCHCAVLLDTKGPEIRSGFLRGHKPVHLKV